VAEVSAPPPTPPSDPGEPPVDDRLPAVAPAAGPDSEVGPTVALLVPVDPPAAAVPRPAEPAAAEPDDALAVVPTPAPPVAVGTAASGVAPPAGVVGEAASPAARAFVAALLDPGVDDDPPEVHERANADARVVLRALESSWIQITSPSGDYLRTRTLEVGAMFLVPNRRDLLLWTGNAGGLEVIIDGEVRPPLGTEGKVLRDISLDPERLLAGTAEP
jgi:cytoskeleton protein RodZ